MHKHFRCLLVSAVLLVIISTDCAAAIRDTVRVQSGLLRGTVSADPAVRVFKGIPYAAPPVGDFRWRAPQPPATWEGVREADHFAPTCMQAPPPEGSFYQVEFFPEIEPMSEDCLYLNVWTPAEKSHGKYPVMMWIHGGGFSQGSGSMPSFDGEGLAKKGIVLVTINYRLGVFGLLAHPALTEEAGYGASGNYGLLDQLAALKWIQGNIEAFGGDPNNVTVFGQSSGAGNVNTLMASPLAEGLFHRAILQSGSVFAFGRKQVLADAEQQGLAFAKALGVASIQALRDLPADSLLHSSSRSSFMPTIDGWLLPEAVDRIFAQGRQHDVPLLAGSTADEGNTLFGPGLTAARYRDLVQRSYGADAAAFLELYPAGSDEEAKRSFNASFSDEIAWGAQALAEVHAQTSTSDTYLYYFSRVPPGREHERYGAFHSAELVYVFSTLEEVGRPWTPTDWALADTMASYWTNFAASGDPNGAHLPVWPAYNARDRLLMELGDDVEARVLLDEATRAFFEKRWIERDSSQ